MCNVYSVGRKNLIIFLHLYIIITLILGAFSACISVFINRAGIVDFSATKSIILSICSIMVVQGIFITY